jgi:hypothetical protein
LLFAKETLWHKDVLEVKKSRKHAKVVGVHDECQCQHETRYIVTPQKEPHKTGYELRNLQGRDTRATPSRQLGVRTYDIVAVREEMNLKINNGEHAEKRGCLRSVLRGRNPTVQHGD